MIFRQVFGRVFHFEIALAAAVFIAVIAAMAYGLVRYRAGNRPGRKASQDTEHTKVEAVYAVALLLVAIGIVVFTSQQNAKESSAHSKPAALEVVVTGFQWCWKFHYVKPSVSISGECHNGRYPTLVLPTNELVRIVTTSDDVIHSFWMPHFRYKMDAFPHHRNSFEITISHPGDWLGHCAEFCGYGHSTMLFHLKALPPDQFQHWLTTRPAAGSAVVSP